MENNTKRIELSKEKNPWKYTAVSLKLKDRDGLLDLMEETPEMIDVLYIENEEENSEWCFYINSTLLTYDMLRLKDFTPQGIINFLKSEEVGFELEKLPIIPQYFLNIVDHIHSVQDRYWELNHPSPSPPHHSN